MIRLLATFLVLVGCTLATACCSGNSTGTQPSSSPSSPSPSPSPSSDSGQSHGY